MSKKHKWPLIILVGSTVILLSISYIQNITRPASHVSNGSNSGTEKMFNESYKERLSDDPEQEEFTEFFDEESNIYSNHLYDFSVIFPPNWTTDRGFSEHTVIRGIEKDSAITFSVNVFDVGGGKDDEFSIWKDFDSNRSRYDSQFKTGTESSLQSTLYNFSVAKITYDNHKAIKTEYVYDVKHIDFEYQMKAIMFQISKTPYIYTIGIQVPFMFYEENPERYFTILNGFYFQ